MGGAAFKRRMDVTGYFCNLSINTGVVSGGRPLSALFFFFQVKLVIPHFIASTGTTRHSLQPPAFNCFSMSVCTL